MSAFVNKSLEEVSDRSKPFPVVDGPFGTQLRAEEYKPQGIPLVRVTNLSFNGRFKAEELVFISEQKAAEIRRSEVTKNDLLVAKTGATIGKCGLFPYDRGIIASSCIKISVDPTKADPHFLLHRVVSPEGQKAILEGASGSTRTTINIDPFKQIIFPFPEPAEQSRIAAVLDVVDEVIAETEAVIAKLRQVRAGLLHNLLPRGLDAHGRLRDPIAHSEQFQESPVGRIPQTWRVAALSLFVPTAEYGISSSLGDRGTLVLRMNNFAEGEAEMSDLKFTEALVPDSLLLRPGDVLFNRTNSWEHVGRTGIWRGQIERATFASYLVRLTPRSDLLLPELLNLWLNWPPTQVAMRRFATPAVQQVNINPTNLRMLLAAFPSSTDEQSAIVSRFGLHDQTIRAFRDELAKLEQIKSGLMTDLLKGQVRVPEKIEPARARG